MQGMALQGLHGVFIFEHFLMLFSGCVLGIVVGALPGLTATMGLALLVPFTFGMSPETGLILMAGLYVGAMYGDSIPAILINTPGTPSAIATTLDGFPLTQKGMAQHALIAAAVSSSVGSLIANVTLMLAAPALAAFSLKFGPPEYFWMGVFGLTMISALSSDRLLKGFLAGGMGMMLSFIGIATIGGDVRLTFGITALQGGIELIVALIGFFCLPEVFINIVGQRSTAAVKRTIKPKFSVIGSVLRKLISKPVLLLRSAVIGTIVGFAPGVGGNIAGIISYNEAQRWTKSSVPFGKGCVEGVVASETANSAMAPGSLIPLLTLGIPGSPAAAVILGALMVHRMRPGPDLFTGSAQEIIAVFMMALFVAALIVAVVGTLGSMLISRVVNVPTCYLAPAIIFMSVIGAYSIRNSLLDVWIMLLFGVIGFMSRKLQFNPTAIVLGLILGPFIEEGLVRSVLAGQVEGVVPYMVLRPISAVLIACSMLSLCWPIVVARRAGRARRMVEAQTAVSQKTINSDIVLGSTGLVAGAAAFVGTRNLSMLGSMFVDCVVVVVCVLSFLLIVKGVWRPDRVIFFDSPTSRNNIVTGFSIIVFSLLLLPVLGFLLTSYGLYFFFSLYLADGKLTGKAIFQSLILSLCVVTAFYYLFHAVLHVPLPPAMWNS